MVAVALKRNHQETDADTSKARFVRRGPVGTGRVPLRTLREGAGLTQEQLGKAIGTAQGDVSKLENASSLDDRTVATLRKYLAAIGAELELAATFKLGHRFVVVGRENPDSPPSPPDEKRLRLSDLPTIPDDEVHRAKSLIFVLQVSLALLGDSGRGGVEARELIERLWQASHGRDLTAKGARQRVLFKILEGSTDKAAADRLRARHLSAPDARSQFAEMPEVRLACAMGTLEYLMPSAAAKIDPKTLGLLIESYRRGKTSSTLLHDVARALDCDAKSLPKTFRQMRSERRALADPDKSS